MVVYLVSSVCDHSWTVRSVPESSTVRKVVTSQSIIATFTHQFSVSYVHNCGSWLLGTWGHGMVCLSVPVRSSAVAMHQKGGKRKRQQTRLSSINIWLYVYMVFSSEKWICPEAWQWKLSTGRRWKSPRAEKIVCFWTAGWLHLSMGGVCLSKK